MSETDKYKVPKNAVKIPAGDTGYNMVKKSYNRFIWTWNGAPENDDDDYNEDDAKPNKMKYIKECEDLSVEKELPTDLSVEEVAELHDVSNEYIEAQLNRGIAAEGEAPNTAIASQIALGHLMKDPNYYADDVEESKVGDGLWNNVSTKEISGMGTGAPMPSGTKGTVGYMSGPLSKNKLLPSEWVADPDDVDKTDREMHNLRRFKDFFKQ